MKRDIIMILQGYCNNIMAYNLGADFIENAALVNINNNIAITIGLYQFRYCRVYQTLYIYKRGKLLKTADIICGYQISRIYDYFTMEYTSFNCGYDKIITYSIAFNFGPITYTYNINARGRIDMSKIGNNRYRKPADISRYNTDNEANKAIYALINKYVNNRYFNLLLALYRNLITR